MKKYIYAMLAVSIIVACQKGPGPDTAGKGEKTDLDKILIVNTAALTLRENPDQKSSAIASLFRGRALTVISESDKSDTIDGITAKWVKVFTSDNKTGYAFSGYLKKPDNCETAEKISIRDTLRDSICKGIGNFYECSVAIENKEIGKYGFVTRNGKELMIKLANGKDVKYTNVVPQKTGEETEVTSYTFRECIESINSFIIVTQLYEGQKSDLVNYNSGQSVTLLGVPMIISPDKSNVLNIAVASVYETNGIQIVSVDKTSVKEAFKTTDFNPLNARWIDNNTVEVVCMNSTSAGIVPNDPNCYIYAIRIRKVNNSWVVEK